MSSASVHPLSGNDSGAPFWARSPQNREIAGHTRLTEALDHELEHPLRPGGNHKLILEEPRGP